MSLFQIHHENLKAICPTRFYFIASYLTEDW